jgi:hypothetical protein
VRYSIAFGLLYPEVFGLTLYRSTEYTSKSPFPADYLGLSQHLWAVHNVGMGLGAVEIFFILVVVAVVVYVVWRLVVRPRR